MGAFQEVQAISRSTKCKKYLYSLSLNPPAHETVTRDQFYDAIARAEETLGLSGQPLAIVFHTKEGRTHAHAVWSRINLKDMRAIKLNYPKRKLKGLALELFAEHGWTIPQGLIPGQEADPMNYTYAEFQEAKRGDRSAKQLKQHIKLAWASSNGRQSFESALEKRGLFLAQGDRRGFVCVDYAGNPYSLSRWSGARSKELSEKLGEPANYPTVDEVKGMVAERMTPKVKEYIAAQTEQSRVELRDLEAQRTEMTERHRQQRRDLLGTQDERWKAETADRASRFATGLKGLWHRINGRHAQIARENELDAKRCLQRDQTEAQELSQQQQRYRQQLQEHIDNARSEHESKLEHLHNQLAAYGDMIAADSASAEYVRVQVPIRLVDAQANKPDLDIEQ